MKIHFVFFLTLMYAFQTQAQWIETGGPLGGLTYDIAKSDNNKLWAATERALYYSLTDGNTWSPVANTDHCTQVFATGDTVMAIYNIFVKDIFNNNDYYAAYSITTVNNGNTWSTPSYITSSMTPIYTMTLHKIGTKFHLHNFLSADLESTNMGQTWNFASSIIPNATVMEVSYHKNTAFQYESGQAPLQKKYRCVSFNAKTSWAYIDSSGNGNLKVVGAIGNALFFLADTLSPKILRSTNLGANMDTVFILPIAFPKFVQIRNHEDTLYLTVCDTAVNYPESSIYKSIDMGFTWNAMGQNATVLGNQKFQILNSGDYICGGGYNMMKYSPISDTSYIFNNSIKSQIIWKLVTSGSDLYGYSNYCIYRSTDDGAIWENVAPFTNSYSIKDIAVKGDTLALITNDSIFISFNKGNSWTAKLKPGFFDEINIYGNFLFGNQSGDISSYSSDWGNIWTISVFQGGIGTVTHYLVNDKDTALYDFLIDGFSTSLYKYNSISQEFELKGNTNLGGIGAPRRITKQGNVWFNYGESSALEYSNNGLNWSATNTAAIPVSPYWNPYTGRPTYANGIFYSHYDDTTFIYSTNMGASWSIVPGNNSLSFLKFWTSFDHEELVSHKGVLYLPTFFQSVWRRNDTMRVFTGNIYFDANNNSIKDINEDNLQNIIAYTPSAFGNSNANGTYGILTDQVGDSLKIVLPNIAFSSNPNYLITSISQLNNNDFGLTAPNNISDFSIDATNVANFNPGFQTNILLDIENLGTVNQTSNVTVELDTNLTYQNATPPPASINGNVFSWNIPALAFTNHHSINISVLTKVGTPNGSTITCECSVLPLNTDIYISNNSFSLNEIVLASFDPNDKSCKQGAYFTTAQLNNEESLEYTIRFQNTGNTAAAFVNITDSLSSMLDLSTFKVLNASHSMTYELKGKGAVKFVFNPINLPPAIQNEQASHGFVKYGIRPKKDIAVGNVISNTAAIYFDFNTPIQTNSTYTEIVYPSQVLTVEDDVNADVFSKSILIYPNPAINSFYVNINNLPIGYDSYLRLFDLKGRQILSQSLTKEINIINNDHLANGLYIGVITDIKNHTISTFKIEIRK